MPTVVKVTLLESRGVLVRGFVVEGRLTADGGKMKVADNPLFVVSYTALLRAVELVRLAVVLEEAFTTGVVDPKTKEPRLAGCET